MFQDFWQILLYYHLNLQHHFDKVYKKASARVKLLSRIREQIGPPCRRMDMQSDDPSNNNVLSSITTGTAYGGTIAKLQSIQDRAAKIVKPYETTE